jgi:RimJ/RimL family protein N-acetyltransferase
LEKGGKKMIEGWVVNLRRLKANDLRHLVKWRRDMELMACYDGLFFNAPDEVEQDLKRHIAASDRLDFLIETKKGKPLGIAFFDHIDRENRRLELNVMIGEKQGGVSFHGANSAFLLVLYAFEKMNMRKIYGRFIEYASESKALIQAVGFQKEAVWRDYFYQKGRRWDFHVYGLLKRDFEIFLKTPKGRKYLNASQRKMNP